MTIIDKDEQLPYRASVHAYRHFKTSDIWHDMQLVLDSKKELLTSAIAREKDVMDIKSLVGQLKELYYLLDLPDMIIEELVEAEEAKKEQTNE